MSPDPRPQEPPFAEREADPGPPPRGADPAEAHLEHWSGRLQAYVSMLNMLTPVRPAARRPV